MNKLVTLVCCFSLVLLACSDNSDATSSNEEKSDLPSPCECAKANQSKDEDLMAICKQLREDSAFDQEYRKCVAAEITGKDPSKVNLVDSEKMKLSIPEDGTYRINPDDSKLIWTGNAMTKKHTGSVKIKEGTVTITDGVISGGHVVVDMTTIQNHDLDGDKAVKLENHLRSDDFFGVEQYPTAEFTFKDAKFIDNKAVVEGDLTVKGKTNPITINLLFSGDGKNGLSLSGAFLFDRSKYDVRYGSESFFDNLGDDLIKDLIMMKFDIKATK